jgi:hypothetical protein
MCANEKSLINRGHKALQVADAGKWLMTANG